MNLSVLHDWVFHYNTYTGNYDAVTRDNYTELFSGNKGNVISAKSQKTLESMIIKGKGDIKKIRNLVR